MIVVDASVLLTALIDSSGSGAVARRVLQRCGDLWAPEPLDVEVLPGVRGLWLGGHVSAEDAQTALEDLVNYPVTRVALAPLVFGAWAHRSNVTAHDAVYVALASRLDTRLLTADAALAGAPNLPCEVRLLSLR